MTKHRVQFEYTMHCSEILYEYMATAEGLFQNGFE